MGDTQIRIKAEYREKLKELAELEKRSMAKTIEILIEREYERQWEDAMSDGGIKDTVTRCMDMGVIHAHPDWSLENRPLQDAILSKWHNTNGYKVGHDALMRLIEGQERNPNTV